MKLLWSFKTEYPPLQSCYFDKIIDEGDVVYIPIKRKRSQGQYLFTFLPIDKFTGNILQDIPQKVVALNSSYHYKPYNKIEYKFGNKIIKSKDPNGGYIIECLENDKVIWEFKHWAFLYTDIIQKGDCAIFGTDGNGGRLYCIEIETGKLVSETKTHFSGFYDYRKFIWYNDNLVLYGKGNLIVLNPLTGEIVDEHKIPSKYPYRSFLQLINGYAYCCVLTDDNQATIMCFEL